MIRFLKSTIFYVMKMQQNTVLFLVHLILQLLELLSKCLKDFNWSREFSLFQNILNFSIKNKGSVSNVTVEL